MRPLVLFLIAAFTLQAQVPRLTEVQEGRLANGARVLLVERRGLGAFHATLVFRGGRAEEPTALAGATDLLAAALYGATWPEDLGTAKVQADLETLLKQEEGLLEAVRLERLRQRRDGHGVQLTTLEAGLAALQERLKGQGSASPLADLYTARGGRQAAEATADALWASTELPLEAFEFWCRTEAQRLRVLQLSRFSAARTALAAQLRSRDDQQGLALLRGAALPGHPYGRDLADHLSALEALRWSDLRVYARRALEPDRLTIIVIGGLGLDQALPSLERTLGSLPVPPDREETLLPEIPADLGDRRVQATLGGEPHLLVGWRLPPRSHPDHLALTMAAQLLAGGSTSRLPARLVRQKALAQEVRLRLDVPGGRLPGLLAVDLKPAGGHSLAELESALHDEILRLQQEPISQEEWSRGLAQLEAEHVRAVDDPATLARSLGRAWAEGGDWRLLELDLQHLRVLAPETVQAAARTWLKPTHRTTALLEPSATAGLDPLEAETAKVLTALAASRIQDLAAREHMVAEGLRQLRMLSPEERRRTLTLLTAQLPPEKR